MSLEKALEDLRKGKFVLVHDSSNRENETDLVLTAERAEPEHIARLRQDAGGLICVAIHPVVAKKIEIPYLSSVYKSASSNHEILNSAEVDDLPYDERSAFSISVNHRDTFTGITDADRALTIRELGKLSSRALKENPVDDFGENFRTPGHVPLLRAADNLVEGRKGHTELSVALMEMAGVSPSAAVCEMLDAETNRALSRKGAKEYSKENELVYLEGERIRKGYIDWEKNRKED